MPVKGQVYPPRQGVPLTENRILRFYGPRQQRQEENEPGVEKYWVLSQNGGKRLQVSLIRPSNDRCLAGKAVIHKSMASHRGMRESWLQLPSHTTVYWLCMKSGVGRAALLCEACQVIASGQVWKITQVLDRSWVPQYSYKKFLVILFPNISFLFYFFCSWDCNYK